jgi:uncharacterized protein involved in outer membrane biogenesis
MRFARIALVVVIVLAVGAYAAYRSIDLLVVFALEHYGPDVTGTNVKVRGVHISAFDGLGRVDDLELASPAGFSAPHAARVGEIRVSLEPRTVTTRNVLVHELAISRAELTYERGDHGANIEAIQRHIQSYIEREAGSAQHGGGASSTGPRRYLIERLSIRGVKVTMTHPALKGQGITFDLPDVELHDVGQREGGLPAGEVAKLVASTLEQKIAQKVLTRMDLLREGGAKGAWDALRGLLK